jgi:hypothetical protein
MSLVLRKPLKGSQRSEERQRYQDELDEAAVLLFRRSRGMCEAKLPGCTGEGTTPHHRRLRSQGGTNDLHNLLAVDPHCHRKIHDNPLASYICGFLVHSWTDPESIPVRVGVKALWETPVPKSRRLKSGASESDAL